MGLAVWVWPPLIFATVLAAAALARRRLWLAASVAAYAASVVLLARADGAASRFAAPLYALVAGYWLTGPFYVARSGALERWLLRWDDALGVDSWAPRLPAAVMLLFEAAYIGCYPFIVAAAVPAFLHSRGAFETHWTLVLAAELVCYITLPWLQARPPRDIRPQTVRRSPLRVLNETLLANTSVRAATIPSGHVAGPVAASLSVITIDPSWGWPLLAGAGLIAIATVAARYHYAVDAVAGLLVGLLPSAIRAAASS